MTTSSRLLRHPIVGIVLSGGASSRLGRDKACEPVGGVPMLVRVTNALHAVCSHTIIVGQPEGRRDLLLPPDATWVPDEFPGGRGPLAGLHAGLSAATTDFVIAVGCDMPFLNPLLLSKLTGMALDPAFDRDAVLPNIGGVLQPLHAIYRRSATVGLATDLLMQLERPGLRDLAGRLQARYVLDDEVRAIEPGLRSFWSVNDEDDLARAHASAAAEGV
ncbi:MAG: molybdenum cofactor guanylyltransferase [Chloroflexi bacterium]|nr:molybdenum cofactor guanylyltransferase [Chloroflexota bacterium]